MRGATPPSDHTSEGPSYLPRPIGDIFSTGVGLKKKRHQCGEMIQFDKHICSNGLKH